MRILPRIPGTTRETVSPRVEAEIKEKLNYLMKMHDCSRSFVVNTILAEYLNIKLKARFYDYRKTSRKLKKSA
jgi:hypothetical protein